MGCALCGSRAAWVAERNFMQQSAVVRSGLHAHAQQQQQAQHQRMRPWRLTSSYPSPSCSQSLSLDASCAPSPSPAIAACSSSRSKNCSSSAPTRSDKSPANPASASTNTCGRARQRVRGECGSRQRAGLLLAPAMCGHGRAGLHAQGTESVLCVPTRPKAPPTDLGGVGQQGGRGWFLLLCLPRWRAGARLGLHWPLLATLTRQDAAVITTP